MGKTTKDLGARAAHDAATCPQCREETKRAAGGGARASADDDYVKRGKGGGRNIGFLVVLGVHWLLIAGLLYGMHIGQAQKEQGPMTVAPVDPDPTPPDPKIIPPIPPIDTSPEIFVPAPVVPDIETPAGPGAPTGSPDITPPGPDVPVRVDPRRPLAKPDYPLSEKRQDHEGIVSLLLLVGPDGRVVDVRVEKSSGYPALDAAAVEAARGWRFKPAEKAGQPVTAWYRTSVRFQLDGK